MSGENETVDLNALKFNQILIVAFVAIGFVLDQRAIPALVAAVLIVGASQPRFSFFRLAYKYIALPLKIMSPKIVAEKAAPHRFAQLLGGIVLGTGAAFLYVGSPVPGWSLAWAVVVLASLNVLIGFCAGCFLYFQLSRLKLFGDVPAEKRG
jgi:hypothetical protein